MPASYEAPISDTLFVMRHVVGWDRLSEMPGFAEATPDTITAILEEGGRFVGEVLQPLNQSGDREGCTHHPDGRVTTPAGFAEAYRAFVDAGWSTLKADPQWGGQGMPMVVGTAFQEYLTAANMAFAMYPNLTEGAVAAIAAAGTDEQKALYLPPMVSGKWTGTMNLTEPQAGTDLGLIRTRATPRDDGSWSITGTKIFISAGEHDLSENIVHLVLAKTPDAPDTAKGISLFIVPKYIPGGNSPPVLNAVRCGSIEEKMGIHGNATCVMNYDEATGWLLGPEMGGLQVMFIMMNLARLGVGIQGLGQSEVATQNAVAYARERLQGRALTGAANPDGPADPLLVHPDVRRMLMDARAFNEGARALALWAALQADIEHASTDAAERERADDLLGLLTPVIKSWFTEQGYVHATNAQQVFGGHGYIREWGMEQFVRDARIALIYEGANGIQAMDLVGRKLPRNGGRALRAFLALVDANIQQTTEDSRIQAHAQSLRWAKGKLEAATMWLMENALSNPDNAGAAAAAYLRMVALVAMGHVWLIMTRAAVAELQTENADKVFLEAKLLTGQHFFERTLPEISMLGRQVEVGGATLMAMPAEAF